MTDRKRVPGLGVRLAHYRHRAHLTQADLAQVTGLNRNFIAGLETGVQAMPYPDKLNALHGALGFPGYEMLELMGYVTDGGVQGLHPKLVAVARSLPMEMQEDIAYLAQAWLRGAAHSAELSPA